VNVNDPAYRVGVSEAAATIIYHGKIVFHGVDLPITVDWPDERTKTECYDWVQQVLARAVAEGRQTR
jgi:hypothetical protein